MLPWQFCFFINFNRGATKRCRNRTALDNKLIEILSKIGSKTGTVDHSRDGKTKNQLILYKIRNMLKISRNGIYPRKPVLKVAKILKNPIKSCESITFLRRNTIHIILRIIKMAASGRQVVSEGPTFFLKKTSKTEPPRWF